MRRKRQRSGARTGRLAKRPLPPASASWFESYVKQRLPHDAHIFLLSLAAGLPAVIACVVLLWVHEPDDKIRWTVGALVTLAWLFVSMAVRERVLRPLQ